MLLPVAALGSPVAARNPLVGSHVVDLPTLLEAYGRLGMSLPRELLVLGVVAADLTTFAERLTPQVAQSVDIAALRVADVVRGWLATATSCARS